MSNYVFMTDAWSDAIDAAKAKEYAEKHINSILLKGPKGVVSGDHYDEDGKLVGWTNSRGEYNEVVEAPVLNKIVGAHKIPKTSEFAVYGDDGRLIATIDTEKAIIRHHRYGENGELKTVATYFPKGGATYCNFEYDEFGRCIKMDDKWATQTFKYGKDDDGNDVLYYTVTDKPKKEPKGEYAKKGKKERAPAITDHNTTYDELGNIIRIEHGSSTGKGYVEEIKYDGRVPIKTSRKGFKYEVTRHKK